MQKDSVRKIERVRNVRTWISDVHTNLEQFSTRIRSSAGVAVVGVSGVGTKVVFCRHPLICVICVICLIGFEDICLFQHVFFGLFWRFWALFFLLSLQKLMTAGTLKSLACLESHCECSRTKFSPYCCLFCVVFRGAYCWTWHAHITVIKYDTDSYPTQKHRKMIACVPRHF